MPRPDFESYDNQGRVYLAVELRISRDSSAKQARKELRYSDCLSILSRDGDFMFQGRFTCQDDTKKAQTKLSKWDCCSYSRLLPVRSSNLMADELEANSVTVRELKLRVFANERQLSLLKKMKLPFR